ncbi:relaxase/mobilization nuclease domain-containing protein [Butyrivibrio sp. INlla16]|uniref:relaxase/mobilization nuclease domain-containing protein n=1 Tax=Butyrivibrio sp. INlla16 TaxID=1520807 RepID=UPI00088AA8FD|nr:relaxase/mobilization nuclease domain-containing protein [Butyrivibrio sp. INlla16]SDB68836.1 Relaxase/Mobilisation nuclease domain-containing protein [Butyrivibrio sp. INlla16]
MGVLRVKSYHTGKSVSNGLSYAEDKKKTTYKEKEMSDYEQELNNVFKYAENTEKTLLETASGEKILVSGHNCKVGNVKKLFDQSRELYLRTGHEEQSKTQRSKRLFRAKHDENGEVVRDKHGNLIYDEAAPVYRDKETGKAFYETIETKTKPRLAYMWMMSFPGKKELGYELSPEVVHEIGVKFCKEFLPDYAASISTHINTDHYHNHIVSCAYSIDGTHKYDDSMENLNKARALCDELSLEYGLPIIINPSNERSMSWTEWSMRREGKSWKEQLRSEIKMAAQLSSSFEEYKEIMTNAGYRLRETDNHITYHLPSVLFGKDYVCRDSMLNIEDDYYDYSKTGIMNSFATKAKEQEKAGENSGIGLYLGPLQIQRYTLDERRRTDIEIVFVEFLKALSLAKMSIKGDKSKDSKAQYLENYARIMDMTLMELERKHITSFSDLEEKLSDKGREISISTKELKDSGRNAKLYKSILKKIDDSMFYKDALLQKGIGIEDLNINRFSENEIRIKRAALDQMQGNEKKRLYVLLAENPNIKSAYPFNELSREEGLSCIRYLEGKSEVMPDVMYNSMTDIKKSLEVKYDKMYLKSSGIFKEKNTGKAITRAQKSMLGFLMSNGASDTSRLEEIQNLNINIENLSFYDAYRLISYLKDSFSPSERYGEIEKPDDKSLKLARELMSARGVEGSYKPEEYSKEDIYNFINFLLYKDKRPEILKSRTEIEREISDATFDRFVSGLDADAGKIAKKERELLNDLSSMGITPDKFTEVRDRLVRAIEDDARGQRELKILKAQYRELKQIDFMARVASEKERFTGKFTDDRGQGIDMPSTSDDIKAKKDKEKKEKESVKSQDKMKKQYQKHEESRDK